jgi:hypothetical protein
MVWSPLDWWADRSVMQPGQLAADTYAVGQALPGDFEAEVLQHFTPAR